MHLPFWLPSLLFSLSARAFPAPTDQHPFLQDLPHAAYSRSHLSQWCNQSKTDFLQAFRKGGVNEWVVVIGNEAADTDSMVSSLALAYHLAHRIERPEKAVALLQIDRKAISYRPENTLALKIARMESVHQDLLTLDQLPFHRGKVAQMIKGLMLVDHNRPLSYWAGAPILGIVDHHQDRGINTSANPRIVEMVGSASSLVSKIIIDGEHRHQPIPVGLADLLLSAIAIDTKGLKKGKSQKADMRSARALFGRSSHQKSSFKKSMKKLSKDLKHAQGQIKDLSLAQLYSRDYKGDLMYNSTLPVNVGYANVPESLAEMVDRAKNGTIEGLFHETREWITDNKVDVLIIMTKSKTADGDKVRELILAVKHGQNLNEEGAERIYHKVRGALATNKELSLKPWKDEDDWGHQRFAWKQTGKGEGRKTIRPIVETAIQEW